MQTSADIVLNTRGSHLHKARMVSSYNSLIADGVSLFSVEGKILLFGPPAGVTTLTGIGLNVGVEGLCVIGFNVPKLGRPLELGLSLDKGKDGLSVLGLSVDCTLFHHGISEVAETGIHLGGRCVVTVVLGIVVVGVGLVVETVILDHGFDLIVVCTDEEDELLVTIGTVGRN